MLFDRLVTCDNLFINPAMSMSGIKTFVKVMIERAKLAHKFALTDASINLVDSFIYPDASRRLSDYAAVDKLKEIARFPYQNLWVEYPDYIDDMRVGMAGMSVFENDDGFTEVLMVQENKDPRLPQVASGMMVCMAVFKYNQKSVTSEPNNQLKVQAMSLIEDKELSSQAIPVLVAQLVAIMAFINSPNIYKSSDEKIDGSVNVKRVRSGKAFLHDYSVLDLKKEIRESMSETENTHDGRRLHWKRGHFKQRKTGLFWWKAHLAGRKELGFHEKDYSV